MLNTRVLALLACVVCLACAAPGARETPSSAPNAAPSAAPAQPKRVVIALRGDPFTLSGELDRAGAGHVYGLPEVEKLVHAGLGVQDELSQMRPVLAEAIPSAENGLWQVLPDGRMETTWKIRNGAQWHDGTPFTSADLVFTWQVVSDPEMAKFKEAPYPYVDQVRAIDDRTVTVSWTRPYILADQMFSGNYGMPQPAHLLQEAYREDKASYEQLPYWAEGFVGTGAFKVKSWVHGGFMVVTAFDQYALGRPKIDEIEIRFAQDANALLAGILAGEIEMTVSSNGLVSLTQALQIKDQWTQGRIEPVVGRAIGIYPQLLIPSPPVVANLDFRRALLHATDRQGLVDTLEGGLSQVAHTHYTTAQPDFVDIQSYFVKYDYSPPRAVQMIQALGYTRGADGQFRDAAGQLLSVELRSSPGRDVNDKATLAVADFWKQAGVGVDTLMVPPQLDQDSKFRATRPAFEVVGIPDDPSRLASSQIPTPANNYLGNNRSGYASATLDAAIEKYVVTIPRADRIAALGAFIHEVTDQLVVMPLFYEASPLLVSKRIQNVHAAAPTWNGHEWDTTSR